MKPKFVLADHSLLNSVSHHASYNRLILREARQRGFTPVLIANKAWRDNGWPDLAETVLPVFTYSTYQTTAVIKPNSDRLARAFGWWDSPRTGNVKQLLTQGAWRIVQDRRVRRLSAELADVFGGLNLAPGDHVFFPVISDQDLAAISRYFRHSIPPDGVAWHFQFHFGCTSFLLEDGRSRFRDFVSNLRLPSQDQNLLFYASTGSLARLYSDLELGEVVHLPFPVERTGQATVMATSTSDQRSVLLLPGKIRQEKGHDLLMRIRDNLHPDLQIVMQSSGKEELDHFFGDEAAHIRQLDSIEEVGVVPDRVVAVRSPLDPDEQDELLGKAHIAALPYQQDRYRWRCSAILLEMLVRGVPVVVPADTWLAEYLQSLDPAPGIIVETPTEWVDKVNRVVEAYPEFRGRAGQHARMIATRHHPTATLEILLSRGGAPSPSP